jgi:spore coat protein YutH
MKQFLKYYYDIYIDKINQKDNIYYFYKDNSLFCILNNYRSNDEINDILQVSFEILKNGFPVSEIILNKYNQVNSIYENNNYVLLKINCNTLADINLNDILKINDKLFLNKDKKDLYRNNWANLWEQKIDYFEYQIKELGRSKTIVLNSFSYYIGLAENAISIANISNIKNQENQIDKIVLSHRRINYPNMEYDYYNPLNFIFDLEVRDVAGYLKSMFFYTDREKTLKEFKEYLKKSNISNYEANMLFARLLYPSYYFDVYEKVIEDLKEESELLDIISRVDEYELFLKDIYYELSKKYNIEQVLWITNKKEL